MNGPYDDIISPPHHVSATRPQMPISKRIELGESDIAVLDMKLNLLADRIGEHPEVTLTYFLPDEKKEGGAYVTTSGHVKKIDDVERVIILAGGEVILIGDILDIQGEIFAAMQ